MVEKNLRKEAQNLLKLAKKEEVDFLELIKILQEENKKIKKRIQYSIKEKEFREIAKKEIEKIGRISYVKNSGKYHIQAFYGRNNQEKTLEILTICFSYINEEFLPYYCLIKEFMERMQLREVYARSFIKNLLIGINKYNEILTGKISNNTDLTYGWYIIQPFIEKIINEATVKNEQ